MKTNLLKIFTAMIFIAAVAAGCSNETEDAIKKLGGSDDERKQAIASLMAIPNARESLDRALTDKAKYNAKTRRYVAFMIGQQAVTVNDENAADVLEKALPSSEKEVKLEIVNSLDSIPGEKALKALAKASDDADADVAKLASGKLEAKARTLLADADKVSSTKEKIRLLKEALAANPCSPEISANLASLQRDNGDEKGALATESACGVVVRKMYLAWPFDDDFKKQHISVSSFNKDGAMTGLDDSPVAWEEYELSEGISVVDMRSVTAGQDVGADFSTYASFKISAPAAQDAVVRFGADTLAAIWVNGKKVASVDDADNADYNAEKKARVALSKGDNVVVVKVTGAASRSRFRVRIGGDGAADLKFTP